MRCLAAGNFEAPHLASPTSGACSSTCCTASTPATSATRTYSARPSTVGWGGSHGVSLLVMAPP